MFTIFVGLCALAAGFAIGWCMAVHIGGKETSVNEKDKA
jgi:hypothetical protein